jgi:hypothetical protein
MAIAAHTLMRTSRRSASALPCQPDLEQTMKAIARVSLALLCCTSLGSAVLAQGDESPFYQCTPRVYEEAGAKLDCLGADSRSESCEAFEMPVSELRESGGSYLHSEVSVKDSRRFVDEVTISRATGAFTEIETLDGVLVAKTVGSCVLKKGRAAGR